MPKHKRLWLMLADGERARILASEGGTPAQWQEIRTVESIEQRNMSRDMRTDRPGREQMRATGVHHAFEPRQDPKRQAKQEFTQELIKILSDNIASFDEWILSAPPQSLGDVRTLLKGALQDKLSLTLNKDLTKTSLSDLPDHLPWPVGNVDK